MYKYCRVNYGKRGKCHMCLVIYTGPVFWYANEAFTIFAKYSLLSIYIFARYLHGANLCKSIFSSSKSHAREKPLLTV